jgi:hypothetical protein
LAFSLRNRRIFRNRLELARPATQHYGRATKSFAAALAPELLALRGCVNRLIFAELTRIELETAASNADDDSVSVFSAESLEFPALLRYIDTELARFERVTPVGRGLYTGFIRLSVLATSSFPVLPQFPKSL